MSIDNLNIHQQRRVYGLYQKLNRNLPGKISRSDVVRVTTRRERQIFSMQNGRKSYKLVKCVFEQILPNSKR